MATYPGKDSSITVKKFSVVFKLETRMPKPCNKKLHANGISPDPQEATREATNKFNYIVRRHIDGCKKCQDNNVQKP